MGITLADTIADFYLSSMLMAIAAAAELVATRKEVKYVGLSMTHYFVTLALE